jgi:hypothetical protein
VTTQIGGERFCVFRTSRSKSRLNFLSLLRASCEDYVVNEAALDYLRAQPVEGAVIARLAAHPDQVFGSQMEWWQHLLRCSITIFDRCCHVNCCRAHYGRFGRWTGSSSNVGRRLPFRHGIEAVQTRGRGGAAGAGWNEKVADSREHADEPLQVPGRSKALHPPLASPQRQMRILR